MPKYFLSVFSVREAFLQFVWQHQYLIAGQLKTTDGRPVVIHKPGVLNKFSGPDFQMAHVNIGGYSWYGAVEVHYKSSDWYNHNHHADKAYDQVCLHVVWQHDREVYLSDGGLLPTLVLSQCIAPGIIDRFKALLDVPVGELACGGHISQVERLTKLSMLDHVIWERLQRKADLVHELLIQNQFDWESTLWQWVTRAFGFNANADAMQTLSDKVQLRMLRKHRNVQRHIEAMLLGFAGFLNIQTDQEIEPGDKEYLEMLKADWLWLSTKFGLKDHQMIVPQWKTGGLRPHNHPAFRLAQLSALVAVTGSFFNLLMPDQLPSPHDGVVASLSQPTDRLQNPLQLYLDALKASLKVKPSAYWERHYAPGRPSAKVHNAELGDDAIAIILINTVAPFLVAFGQHTNRPDLMQVALGLLESLPAEKNHLVSFWGKTLGPISTALDSQAVIELKKNYCDLKRCLHCRIGKAIVGR